MLGRSGSPTWIIEVGMQNKIVDIEKKHQVAIDQLKQEWDDLKIMVKNLQDMLLEKDTALDESKISK